MTIVYQGNSVETSATSVAAFLADKGIDVATAIVEYGGEIYGKATDLSAQTLADGAELNVFNIVSGG
ncbi:MAG: MoaD/ThiS family protein [Kiritimatiellae bacterium]|nr:MoaD/ThiS family protein [Kiritimatiellia bacterium]